MEHLENRNCSRTLITVRTNNIIRSTQTSYKHMSHPQELGTKSAPDIGSRDIYDEDVLQRTGNAWYY